MKILRVSDELILNIDDISYARHVKHLTNKTICKVHLRSNSGTMGMLLPITLDELYEKIHALELSENTSHD